MEKRRMPTTTTVFFVIQIVLSVMTWDIAQSLPRPSSTSAVRLRRSGRGGEFSSSRPHLRFSHHPGSLSFFADRQGRNQGQDVRPVFGALSLRSTDNIPPDPDSYWDFVLGGETFKRRDYRRMSEESTSGRGRVRRDVASAGSRRPIFDVLGRHVNDKDRPQVAAGGAYNDEVSDRDLSELKKKTDEEENRSFFPSTSGENHEFYNFLLGEYGR